MMCAAAMRTLAADLLRVLYVSPKPEAKVCSTSSFSLLGQQQSLFRRRSHCCIDTQSWSSGSDDSKRTRGRRLVLAAASAAAAASMATKPSGQSLTLKERLHNGDQLYGAFSVSFSPVVAEILGWAGYDFVVVDLEHGPGDTMAAVPVLQALASTGTPAIIRIPANDPVWAKKALDLGPAGIMFPMIHDASAAREAVRACRYPPRGVRGAAFPIVRAARFGMDPDYLSRCEDDLLIMCQLESQQAVDNVAEIAAVDGVDCIQMGPLDLRADLGLLRVPDDKRPSMLLREVEITLKSSGVFLAGFATNDDPPSKLLKLGYHMVSGAIDVALLRDGALADIRKAKDDTKSA